jgi:hypothetical protein
MVRFTRALPASAAALLVLLIPGSAFAASSRTAS